MSDLVVLPDAERLLVGFLLDQDELAALINDRVYTVVPSSPAFPLLRLSRIGGAPPMSRPLWVDSAFVQVDAWGGPKAQARAVAETARALLADRLLGAHDDGVVTDVTFGEMRYEPDETYPSAKPRYLFTATVSVRPADNPGS